MCISSTYIFLFLIFSRYIIFRWILCTFVHMTCWYSITSGKYYSTNFDTHPISHLGSGCFMEVFHPNAISMFLKSLSVEILSKNICITFSDRTNNTFKIPSSMYSLTKWYRVSMCLVWFPVVAFFAKYTAPMLSTFTSTGKFHVHT